MTQIITGIMLIFVVSYEINFALFKLRYISAYLFYGWFVRDLHMICSNYLIWTAYLHMTKSGIMGTLSSTRKQIWISGATIMLLSILACFTGYILVCGQMSYWALIVILNLLTVIPICDLIIINTLLVGNSPSYWSVMRVANLHFLVVFITALTFLLHVVFVHRCKPGVLLSVLEINITLLDIVLKDSLFLCLSCVVIVVSASLRFIHPDNYLIYSSIVTPIHIEPECYFLVLFSIIKARTLKYIGVLFSILVVLLMFSLIHFINLFHEKYYYIYNK